MWKKLNAYNCSTKAAYRTSLTESDIPQATRRSISPDTKHVSLLRSPSACPPLCGKLSGSGLALRSKTSRSPLLSLWGQRHNKALIILSHSTSPQNTAGMRAVVLSKQPPFLQMQTEARRRLLFARRVQLCCWNIETHWNKRDYSLYLMFI